jgi:hypothetical protein
MSSSTLRNLLLSLAVIAPLAGGAGAAWAQSNTNPPTTPPGMMWGGPGMMNGNGYMMGPGMIGPGMMGPGMMGPGMMGPGMMGYGMMRGCPAMGAMMAGMMGGGQGGAADAGEYQKSAGAWLDGQIAYAHGELAITAAQEPLWTAYVAAVKARSSQMLESHQSMMGAMWQGGLALDKAYDLHIAIMQAHLDAMKASRDATLKLYAALTPAQQQKASWVLPQSMCMM